VRREAIASAAAIVEKGNPPSLETLTWVRRVEVMERLGLDRSFVPLPRS
jgi:hypothetical protein